MNPILVKAWDERYKLRVKALKLWKEADELCKKHGGKNLCGDWKVRAEGEILWATAQKIWYDAIFEVYGNIGFEWKWRGNLLDCYLENGEIFKALGENVQDR